MIDRLKEIGLTEYEAKIYLTLLEGGTLKGMEIHKKSGVPHSPTYRSLSSLKTKGFVNETPTKPKKFSAIGPKIAIKNFINNEANRIKEIEKEISEKLTKLKNTNMVREEMSEKVAISSGYDKIFPIIQNLFDNSKKITRGIYTYEVRNYLQQKGMTDALKRGIKIRILATKKTPQGLKWIKEDIKLGAEVRYYRVEELRIFIQDTEKSVISMINPKDSRDRVITYFEHGEFSKILAKYFDEVWKKAEIIKL